ncbi:MAG: hypothetical protein JWM19_985 [Actinomycetia bacterium]|nr:hypothetical protein [Actinomycetes bacterium]
MSGYLRTIKTTAVQAIQQSFQVRYPEPDPDGGGRQPFVSVEYPVEEVEYPAIWVDYDGSELRTVGIAYTELDSSGNACARWRFAGHVVFTIVAMSSNERDMIYDQLVSLTAFAAQSEFPSPFRQVVEGAPLVASVWSFDSVEDRAPAAAPGTPWGTMDVIYERGLALQVIGEFVTDPNTTELVPLSEIQVIATATGLPGAQSVIDITS